MEPQAPQHVCLLLGWPGASEKVATGLPGALHWTSRKSSLQGHPMVTLDLEQPQVQTSNSGQPHPSSVACISGFLLPSHPGHGLRILTTAFQASGTCPSQHLLACMGVPRVLASSLWPGRGSPSHWPIGMTDPPSRAVGRRYVAPSDHSLLNPGVLCRGPGQPGTQLLPPHPSRPPVLPVSWGLL